MFQVIFGDPVVIEEEALLIGKRGFDQAFIHQN
jgi:hypothetical protein